MSRMFSSRQAALNAAFGLMNARTLGVLCKPNSFLLGCRTRNMLRYRSRPTFLLQKVACAATEYTFCWPEFLPTKVETNIMDCWQYWFPRIDLHAEIMVPRKNFFSRTNRGREIINLATSKTRKLCSSLGQANWGCLCELLKAISGIYTVSKLHPTVVNSRSSLMGRHEQFNPK